MKSTASAHLYLSSRLGIVNEAIKKAYLSGKRIFVIVTSEYDFIRTLLLQESILGIKKITVNDPETQTNDVLRVGIEYANTTDFIPTKADQVICQSPKVFLYVSTLQQGGGQFDYSFPTKDVSNYAQHYFGLSTVDVSETSDIIALKKSIIVIVTPDSFNNIPSCATSITETIEVPFLSETEFKQIVSEWIAQHEKVKMVASNFGYPLLDDDDYLSQLYQAMRGMSPQHIISCLRKNKIELGTIYFPTTDPTCTEHLKVLLKNIRRETESVISQSSALSLIDTTGAELQEPAGLGNIIKWLKTNEDRIRFPQKYIDQQVEPCNGILVSGIPGTGKSMLAKFIAAKVDLTLIRLNMDAALGKYVGDSEKGIRTALSVAEALSPCVLWIDEMEKAFEGGHEVTRRIIGILLTWMQEKTNRGKSCFVFATANDISKMPPEMFRTGRFDEKFYTFLPSSTECGAIFEKTIKGLNKKYKRKLSKQYAELRLTLFDEDYINSRLFEKLLNDKTICQPDEVSDDTNIPLSRRNKFFIGSDIAQLVNNAMCIYFNAQHHKAQDKVAISSDAFIECLKEAMQQLHSYGETNLEQIALCYSQLATNNFAPASAHELIPFNGYDEWQFKRYLKQGKKNAVLYKAALPNTSIYYDRQLYFTTVRALNDMAEEIIQTKRRL